MPRCRFTVSLAVAAVAATAQPAHAGLAFVPVPRGLLAPVQAARPALPDMAAAAGLHGPRSTWRSRGALGVWFIPETAGTADVDFSFRRPAWTLKGGVFKGNVGLEGAVTAFGTTYAPFRREPYFAPTTFLAEGLVTYRFGGSPYEASAGLATLGQGNLNFGVLGVAVDRPFRDSPLRFQARARVGHDAGTSFFLAGEAAIAYRWRFLEASLGVRHLTLRAADDPIFSLTGPQLSLGARF